MYAEDSAGKKVKAEPKKLGKCPSCKVDLIAKCGKIMVWHWSHKSLRDCDSWAEGESQWHMEWKSYFPAEQVEVSMGNHRADVVTSKGIVIELQTKGLSVDDIRVREVFYKNMVWLFKVEKTHNFGYHEPYDFEKDAPVVQMPGKRKWWSFGWKYPMKCLAFASKPVFLDLGKKGIFEIKKIHGGSYFKGWGYKLSNSEFLERSGIIFNPFSALEAVGFMGRPSLIGDVTESIVLNTSAVITL